MRLKRVIGWTPLPIPLALVAALFVVHWRSDNVCGRLEATPTNRGKAIVFCDYGPADVLALTDVEKSVPDLSEHEA